MFSSSFFQHDESTGRFQVTGRYKKNVDSTGTPETQPETPDSNFDIDSSSSVKRSRDVYSFSHAKQIDTPLFVFSPIGHSSINLQRDYDAETETDAGMDLYEGGGYLGDLTPVAEKSSKRRMIEALRAIARTPEKNHIDAYNTKKDFLSALRGVATTPVKNERVTSVMEVHACTPDDGGPLAGGTSMDISCTSEEASHVDHGHSDKRLSFDNSIGMHTPFKVPDPLSCSSNLNDTNLVQDRYSPTQISESTNPSSPFNDQSFSTSYSTFTNSKELLTPSAKSSKDHFELDLTVDEKVAGSSHALDNYWAAEKDYREALQDFEKEFAKASYSTPCAKFGMESRGVQNVSLSVDGFDDGTYSEQWNSPSPFHGELSSERDDSAQERSQEFVQGTDDIHLLIQNYSTVSGDENPNREDGDDPHILVQTDPTRPDDEQATQEDTTVAIRPSKDGSLEDKDDSMQQELQDSSVEDTSCILCPTSENASEGFMNDIRQTSFEGDACTLSPAREVSMNDFETTSTEVTKDVVEKVQNDTIHDLTQTPSPDINTSGDSPLSHHQRTKTRSINDVDFRNKLKEKDTAADINASFASVDVNVGSKTPSESFSKRQKFIFKVDLPDVSPAKSDESVSVTVSIASSVLTQKMSSTAASYLVSSDFIPDRISRMAHIPKSTLTTEKSDMSPNLLDKATLPEDLDTNSQTANNSLDNFIESTNSYSPNLLDKAILTAKEKGSEGSQLVSDTYPIEPSESSSTSCIQNSTRVSMSIQEQRSEDIQNAIDVTEIKSSELVKSQLYNANQKNELPENIQVSRILSDAIKLNLGPMLTKEILQSLLSAQNKENGCPVLGINHINIDPESDDHSDISSLGTGSMFSSTPFSTFNAWIKNQPQERIENIFHDYNQSSQEQSVVEKKEQSVLASPTIEVSNPFQHSNVTDAFSKPAAKKISFKLQPPRGDTQRSRRKGEMRKIEEDGDLPAVDSHVLNDFDRLQQQLISSKFENRSILAANRQMERECDALQNEKLMNQFEQIQKLECQRRWNTAKKNEVARISDNVFHSPPGNSSVLSSNDWFVDTNAPMQGEDTNEVFSSLLCTSPTNDATDVIIEKKKRYELKHDDNIEDSTSAENETIERNVKKKKKIFKKMMKLVKRKKKSKNDEEKSIGIASVTSMTISECPGKKNRFKFLPSLRRKNRKENTTGDDNRRIGDENELIDERVIIDTMQMIDGMELSNIEDLDESFTTDGSDVSSGTSKGASCGYSSLP